MYCLHVKSYGIIQLFRDKAPDLNSPGFARCDIGEQEITDGHSRYRKKSDIFPNNNKPPHSVTVLIAILDYLFLHSLLSLLSSVYASSLLP